MERIGRYQVIEEIGRGASGSVHRGLDAQGKPVAIKLLHAVKALDPRHRRRFEIEVKSLLRVRHENVVALLDAGEHQFTPFLAMEWIDGESLGNRLLRDGPMDPDAALAMVETLAVALESCHGQGVLHRDLKPGNILLRAGTNEPLLTDFGLAREVSPQASVRTAEGQALGTPGFWPPEQARGQQESVGPASDVYGLGAVLYAALTGVPPQAGATFAEILASAQRLPPPPSTLRPGIERDLDAVCLRSLDPEPSRRYQSPGALAAALKAVREGTPRPRRVAALLLPVLALVAAGVWMVALAAGANEAGGGAGVSPATSTATTLPPPPPPVDPVRELLDRAAALLEARDYPSAMKELDRAVTLDPGRAAVWAARGAAHARLGSPHNAVSDLERALRIEPDRLDLLLQRAEQFLDLDRRGEAQADLEEVLRRDPKNARALANRGFARLRARWIEDEEAELAASLVDLQRAIELDPEEPLAYRGRSVYHRWRGEWDKALADIEKAIKLAPERIELLIERADIKAALDDREGAERDYSQALGRVPEYLHAWIARGSYRERMGDIDGALSDFERAIELDPGDPYARCMRGWIRFQRDDFAGARSDFDAALEEYPEMTMAWHYRGQLRMEENDWQGALVDLQRAAELSPNHPGILIDRGLCKEQAGDLAGAKADFDRTIALDPEYVVARYYRARVLEGLNEWPGALADAEHILKQDPEGWGEDVKPQIERLKGKIAGTWTAEDDARQEAEEGRRREQAIEKQAIREREDDE